MRNRLGTAQLLSLAVVALMLVQSLSGLLFADLYRDPAFSLNAWRANDYVTLLLATPIFLGALVLASKGSRRAQFVWIGMLDYAVYNYAFYLYGTVLNVFFPIYILLFGLAMVALILALTALPVKGMAAHFSRRTPARWIAGYMVVWALFLCVAWLGQWGAFVSTGELPGIMIETGATTHLVAALDLTLMVPFLLLGALLLWRRRSWGFLIAMALNVKGVVYTLALSLGTWLQHTSGGQGGLALLPVWLGFFLASAVALCVLMRRFHPDVVRVRRRRQRETTAARPGMQGLAEG
jgi:hypothetical protein